MRHVLRARTWIAVLVVGSLATGLLFGGASAVSSPRPATPMAAAATSATDFANVPVAGTLAGGRTFRGTLDITRFAVQDRQVVALGSLTGVVRDAGGNVIHRVADVPVAIPLSHGRGTCRILHLEIGPVDLDLLGLVIHINRIVIDITAHRGPGQLLGNLLCALAHLLDGTVPNSVLSNLLTAVVRLVGTMRLLG
jgi:hypothetical protein